MTVKESVARGSGVGERGEIVELAGETMLVPSFTDSGKSYRVHVETSYCGCPAAAYATDPEYRCKHLVLAEAVEEARALRFGSFAAEEVVVELCHRIFAPLKNEHCIDSYRVLLDTFGCRYATEAMERAAARRHGRVLAMHDSERAA